MNHGRRGYVLLLTLVLLVLVAAAMTGVCLRSFNRAVEAAQAQDQLQRRWGAISCKATFLPRTEQILLEQERLTQSSCPWLRRELTLGNGRFTLVFADEQAKANINGVYQKLGDERTRQWLEQLMTSRMPNSAPIELVPSSTDAFTSFGQVFGRDDPQLYIAGGDMEQAATRWLTLWGSGKVNFKRADKETLAALSAFGLEHASDLTDVRQANPTLESAMNALNWDAGTRALARQLLTDETHCHSLWIIPQENGKAKGGEWFSVEEDAPASRTSTFTW